MSKYRGFTKEEEDALFETMRKANAYLEELLEIKKAEALAREKPPTFGPDYLGDNANWCKWQYDMHGQKTEWAFAERQVKLYKRRIAAYLDGFAEEDAETYGRAGNVTMRMKRIRRAICGEKEE